MSLSLAQFFIFYIIARDRSASFAASGHGSSSGASRSSASNVGWNHRPCLGRCQGSFGSPISEDYPFLDPAIGQIPRHIPSVDLRPGRLENQLENPPVPQPVHWRDPIHSSDVVEHFAPGFTRVFDWSAIIARDGTARRFHLLEYLVVPDGLGSIGQISIRLSPRNDVSSGRLYMRVNIDRDLLLAAYAGGRRRFARFQITVGLYLYPPFYNNGPEGSPYRTPILVQPLVTRDADNHEIRQTRHNAAILSFARFYWDPTSGTFMQQTLEYDRAHISRDNPLGFPSHRTYTEWTANWEDM